MAELSKELDAATRKTMGDLPTVLSYWHVAIVLGRKVRRLVLLQVEVKMAEDDDGTGEPGAGRGRECIKARWRRTPSRASRGISREWDLQATHGGVTARRAGGEATTKCSPVTSAPEQKAIGPAETTMMATPDSRGAKSGWKRRTANDAILEVGLQGLFGDGTRWKTAKPGRL
ncbi:hypothetical protein ColLi_02601 [Colletotrichum liriopes]|uniref:Uncharacterized protein n=1 Tax=Colletotrichum liriopes TaxID=708192 RepID=A0AA37GG74_9PEZI|nr:hypothetical protein ColLi_02601 [Colletotrichum liriopes]